MALVRVDRGDGKLFNIAPGKDMDAFMAINPGAKQVDSPAPVSDEVAMPGHPEEVELESMKKAELLAFAEEHDIDLGGAKTNDEIRAAIEAAEPKETE